MGKIRTTYDAVQHCIAVKEPEGKTVAMDCPYTGKGEEFSPGNLVAASLGGCILLSMGTLAVRSELDISGTCVDVDISMVDKPRMRIGAIDITVTMSAGFSDKDRLTLQRAAEHCPIKHSFDSDIPITVQFEYTKQ